MMKQKEVPDPCCLVGKHLEHELSFLRGGAQKQQGLVDTWTVKRMVKRAKEPLFICYNIGNNSSDTDSEDNDDQLLTEWNYKLLINYVNGDLKAID